MLQDSYHHHHQYNYIQNFHTYPGGKQTPASLPLSL